MAVHRYTGTVAASPDDVWAFLTDIGNLPRYLPLMTAARAGDGDRVEMDTVVKGEARTVDAWFRPDATARRIDWGSVGNDAYHGWLALRPDDDGTEVTYELTTPLEHTLEPYLRAATTFVGTALAEQD